MAAKVAEKKILALTSQVTERDEEIRQLKEKLLAVTSQVTKKNEEIRLVKEKLHKKTKGNKHIITKHIVHKLVKLLH